MTIIENSKRSCLPMDEAASPITLNINGKEVSNPIEVGDLFNEYFSSIADNRELQIDVFWPERVTPNR